MKQNQNLLQDIIDNSQEKNVYIKGNLHLNAEMTTKHLKKDGLVFHVSEDVIFHEKDDDFTCGPDDTFIENIFEKFNVKDIIAFSDF